ncbi:MAG: TonB-dependent receptor plug domain-containing protein [Ignavibacteria bacterium]|jgi:hypothetical protein
MSKYLLLLFFTITNSLLSYNYWGKDSLLVPKAGLKTDSTNIHVKDSLINLKKETLSGSKNFFYKLTKKEIDKRDYRYTGNITTYIPFGFLNDLGTNGQPHQINIFGGGFNSVSYLSDGILLNNRISSNYDLNMFQSERIDSVELLPITKGFLYGSDNNAAAINLITRDSAVTAPTTRLRYHQAPEDEEFVNLSFDTKLFKPLYLTVDLTNYSVEPRFENSESGGWKINYRLKYLLSKSTNIILNYNTLSTETQLFGGVDANNKNQIEYDFQVADAVYPLPDTYSSRYQKYKQNFLTFTVLSKIINDSPACVDLYYTFNKTEYRQNERTELNYLEKVINDNSYKTIGLSLSQKFKFDNLVTTFSSTVEQNKFTADILEENSTRNSLSISGITEADLPGNFNGSVFAKYLNYDGTTNFGFGTNLVFNYSDNLSFMTGYSKFQKPLPVLYTSFIDPASDIDKQEISVFESSIGFKSKNIASMFSFFIKDNDNDLLPVITNSSDSLIINEIGMFIPVSSSQKGFNLNFDIQIWNLLFQVNANYMPDFQESTAIYPEYNFAGGAYYLDTLFNNNLKLKAGFNFYSIGQQYFYTIDFQKNVPVKYILDNSNLSLLKNEYTDLVTTVDLFISGTFQDAAVVSFIFENIFDLQYFIVPYYPKQGQGIRLGITWELLN